MAGYIAELDRADFELTDEKLALLVHMVANVPPPLKIVNPVIVGGQTIEGEWRLEHWDTYENIAVYYPSLCADSAPKEMSEATAADYLAEGLASHLF